MTDNDNRIHQTGIRCREMMAQCVSDFAEGGAARQLYADLQAGIVRFEQAATAHGVGLSEARQGTRGRGEARAALKALLDLIRAAAKVMGIQNEFPLATTDSDDDLLQAADVYTAHATPKKADFIKHELPSDFLEDLAAAKAAFQAVIAEQMNAKGDHISAREELDDAGDNIVKIIRKLGQLFKVRYANNPGKLAEWTAASHIERPAKKSKAVESPTTPSSKAEDK